MADVDFREGTAFGGSLHRVQRLVNLTGAVTSVALVGGLAWWGYQLAMRDVTGIPVVRALEGPMRIAPADPGGSIATNMGLSVNAIAAEGEDAAPADRLVLAPRPVELTPEDLPVTAAPAAALPEPVPVAVPEANPSGVLGVIDVAGAAIKPVAPVEVPTETPPPLPEATLADGAVPLVATATLTAGTKGAAAADLSVPPGEPILLDGLIDPAADVPVEAATDPGADMLADPLSDPVQPVLADVLPAAEAEPAPPGALKRSPRPLARPSEMVVLAAADATAPAPTVAKTADPAAIIPGTRLVQLGAFDDESDAIAEWNRLTKQFGGLIADKSRVLQGAQSGGRSFVRLRAMGFADEADARRFCSALLAENAACIPVAQR